MQQSHLRDDCRLWLPLREGRKGSRLLPEQLHAALQPSMARCEPGLGLLLDLREDIVLLVPVFALLLTWPCKKQPLFPAVLTLRTSFLALSIRSSSVTAFLDSLFGEPLAEQSPRSFLSVTLAVPPSYFGEP